MSHRFVGQQTLMRIFIGERDRCAFGKDKGHALHQALLNYFRSHDFPGATVSRAIGGFGAHSRLHTVNVELLSLDLPIVVEVVAAEDAIQRALPDLDRMIDGGLITLEEVRVILYRPHDLKDDERWQHRIEGLRGENGDDLAG
jgi:PII-like signaling protein